MSEDDIKKMTENLSAVKCQPSKILGHVGHPDIETMGDDRGDDLREIADKVPVSEFPELVNGVKGNNDSTPTHSFPKSSGISPDYPSVDFQLEDRYIDEPRSLRVAVIGAGLAGITAAILLSAKVPGIQLTIFEKNFDVAGTWYENKYPGVQCDIPSLVYQSTFSPNENWSEKFARGPEIRDYWQYVARKYDAYRFIKLGHKVQEAVWDESQSIWRLSIKDLTTGEHFSFEAEVLLTAIGRFNAWRIPDIPGIDKYKGLLRHASNWSPDFDLSEKSVAVIGNGASGIQLTANLQPRVKRLDHYIRNKTWIAASWAGDERTLAPLPFSEKEKAAFKDSKEYVQLRKQVEDKYWRRFAAFFRGSQENDELRERFIDIMRKRLAKKPELLERLVPDFSPNCRRLTPGPGYLEALTEDNVELIQTSITEFTESGIVTEDGKHREVDAIFAATGANVDMSLPFPVKAFGKDLSKAWRRDGEDGFPYTYLGLAAPGFPNLFFIHGPHGTGPSGTVPHSVEVQLTYYAKVLRKLSREGIRTITPSKKAAEDFHEYSTAFFAKTALTDHCSSWYNGGQPGGYVSGVWPGSASHVTLIRREPRWEDYEYEYLSKSTNRFAWYFGNGKTRKEQDLDSDITAYLQDPETIDLREYHERWWQWP